MFMNLPDHLTYDDIVTTYQKRKQWKQMATNIGDKRSMYDVMKEELQKPRLVTKGRHNHMY